MQLLDQVAHQSSSSSHDVLGFGNRNSNSHDAARGSVTQVEAGLTSDETTKVAAVMNVNVTRYRHRHHVFTHTGNILVFTSCVHLLSCVPDHHGVLCISSG